MRNLMTVFAVIFMSWMPNAQSQPLTVDPETVVPLPEKFDMETPGADVPHEMARFYGAGSERGTTTGIFSWSSASCPTGMRTWFSRSRTRPFTAGTA